MTEGTGKWFNARKGFGPIAPDAGGGAVEHAGLSDPREGWKIGFKLMTRSKSDKISADTLQILS